ncbi:hypothetical protein FB451DRAFT_1164581 [Mycena latifolia]|nr:hypothetical protein FB451DRAFT_1164581 [Mycena latifolia]
MVATRTKTYASVAMPARTSRKSLLQEAAEVGASFDAQNEAEVLTAEGELQFGTLPAVDQHALSVAKSPRVRASDLDEYLYSSGSQNDDEEGTAKAGSQDSDSVAESDEQDEGLNILCTPDKVDWNNEADGFVVPRIVAKNNYKWLMSEGMDIKYKFFPSWFDLSEDEDQLGPIPQEWMKREDADLQGAIFASIAEGGRSRGTEPARSMAVIVEVPQKPAKSQRSKDPADAKGKGIGAGERGSCEL